MTKQNRNSLASVASGIVLIIGLAIIFKLSLEWYYLLVVLLIATLVDPLVKALIPIKKSQSKKKTAKKSIHIASQKHTSTIKGNLIRDDNEILTIPFGELTWREFERLCFLYYKGKGYKVEETSEGADGGVDLIYFCPENNAKVAVQIKQYSKPINVDIIRNIDSAKKNHKCPLAEIITTSTYTKDAKDEAEARRIVWRDKNWVELFLLPWREKEAKKRKLA